MTAELSAADCEQLAARGIDAREAERQLRLLREPPTPPRLLRPCTVGDGIRRLDEAEQKALREIWQSDGAGADAVKLVPASGAASRMFGPLLALRDEEPFPGGAELSRRAAAGDAGARDLERLWRELPRLPFFDELAAVCAARGAPLSELRERRDGRRLLRLLLGEDGLALASRPKGLIPFHHYRDRGGSRTAAEEHLWEGAASLADEEGVARFHFTVGSEARDQFAAELAEASDRLLRARGVVAEVGFSMQGPSTDTLAITPNGEPFRDDDGSLLLRPSGHGALLDNLGALEARWVLLKNVDNVQPERAHELVAHWQEVLGGLLVRLALEARDHRPLRVCGVVENRGEPGGGPFWVERGPGEVSAQIVERAELGMTPDPAQEAVFASSTHFNPVQIAVALRDVLGQRYDLRRYVDERAVFIARKSHHGRELLALERPGLWNGAMADWNTVFVEVPAETFAPVKTVFDLLRPEHQP